MIRRLFMCHRTIWVSLKWLFWQRKLERFLKMAKTNVFTVSLCIFQFKGIGTKIITSSWQRLLIILPNWMIFKFFFIYFTRMIRRLITCHRTIWVSLKWLFWQRKLERFLKMAKLNVVTVSLSIFQFKGNCTEIIDSSWQRLHVILPNW